MESNENCQGCGFQSHNSVLDTAEHYKDPLKPTHEKLDKALES